MAILTTVGLRRATRRITIKGKQYRKGQFLPKGTRFGAVERYTQRRTDTGRIVAALEVITEKTITKTVTPELLEATGGHIGQALSVTNALSRKSLVGAKNIEIRIKGKDLRNKLHRFVIQIDVEKEKRLNSLLIGRIVAKLHEQRFRTQYDLRKVDWSEAKTSRSFSQRMKQLQDMQIIVKVRK